MSKEEIKGIIAAINHKDRKNKKFIYNYQLANIAMKMGIKCLETGRSSKTGNIFYVFDYNEIQPVYEVWEEYKKEFNEGKIWYNCLAY